MENITTNREFALFVDLMLTVSKKCGEGELTKLLEKFQNTKNTDTSED